ncbi:MAG: prolipoprotein diacylglyceryl transferase [Thermodesulfobacteriota bacterium]
MYPILLKIGAFKIYSYGFFVLIGFLFGVLFSIIKVRKSEIRIPFENAAELLFYSVFSSIFGARILYVLMNLNLFKGNFLNIFKLWDGGLVLYGGLIPGGVIAILYMKLYGLPFLKLSDMVSPSIAFALFWGKIGCFFAGCCYGKETSLPWGVVFKNPNSLARLNVSLHPVQLYEALMGLGLFIYLSSKEKKKVFDGQIFFLLILLYSICRFFLEIFRGDPRGFLIGNSLSISQGLGIILVIISIKNLYSLKRRYLKNKEMVGF